jgi:DnaB helicase-like protein
MKFQELKQMIEDGMEGKNSGIPMGFKRLNNHISIRKSIYYLVGGYTGSGKTSLVDDAFVLNPIDWWLDVGFKQNDIDFEIIYWSMERKVEFKLTKWLARKMFLDSGGTPISLNKILGWVEKKDRLTRDEYELFCHYEEYYDRILEKVHIIGGPQNPMGVKKYVDDYALKNGRMEGEAYNKVYVPNKPNKVTLIISDHIGLTRKEKRDGIQLSSKKEIIDTYSEDARRFRDLYGFSPVFVSQFNRDIANPMRIKNGDVEPQLEDFKESGNTQEDADIVMTLFDPMRYKLPDPSGYSLEKLRDGEGRKKYRSVKILKNSYGSDDIRIGLAFQPEIGCFKELPKVRDITDDDYTSVLDNTFFLTK